MRALRGFAVHSGTWEIEGEALCLGGGLATTGDIDFSGYTLSGNIRLMRGKQACFVVGLKDAQNYVACGIRGDTVCISEVRCGTGRDISTVPWKNTEGDFFAFTISISCDRITLLCGNMRLEAFVCASGGAIGLITAPNCEALFSDITFSSK